jgi:ADP-heptose:LPS heptosyltransferase
VVLRALGLGDLLTGVPALRGLRRAFPQHRIVLATPAWLHELALFTGAVDEVVDVAGLGRPLPEVLAEPDVAVNLHGRGPQSVQLLEALRPARLIAFADDEASRRDGSGWREDEHEVRRWCRLVDAAAQRSVSRAGDLRLNVEPSPLAQGTAMIHPGAAAGSRRWPLGRFGAVARWLLRRGVPVAVTGAGDEVPLARELNEEVGGEEGDLRVLAGRTSVLDLARALAGARMLIVGDTGVAHLATAVGCPSVLLFGPTSPARWGPRIDPDRHVVLWAGTEGDPHAPDPDPGLLRIGVDDVFSALTTLGLAQGAGALTASG